MLRTLVIDPDLNRNVEHLLSALEGVQIVHAISHYPDPVELAQLLRYAPQLALVSISYVQSCIGTAARIAAVAPGIPVIAFGRNCHPDDLTVALSSGVREFLAIPFHPAAVNAALSRIDQRLSVATEDSMLVSA